MSRRGLKLWAPWALKVCKEQLLERGRWGCGKQWLACLLREVGGIPSFRRHKLACIWEDSAANGKTGLLMFYIEMNSIKPAFPPTIVSDCSWVCHPGSRTRLAVEVDGCRHARGQSPIPPSGSTEQREPWRRQDSLPPAPQDLCEKASSVWL